MNQAQRTAEALFASMSDAETIYAATCCGRLSLARSPQTKCRTCPKTPTVTPVRSKTELLAWAAQIPDPAQGASPSPA